MDLSDLPPHTREMVDRNKDNGGTDRKSLPRNRDLKATSLEACNFTTLGIFTCLEDVFSLGL